MTEARSDEALYGEERLFEFLRGTTRQPAREIVRDVVGDAVSFSEGRLRDDLAILALKRLKHGASAFTQQKLDI